MNRSFLYSLKVWLLMVIVAPLLHLTLSWLMMHDPEISLFDEIKKDYIIAADIVLLLTIPFALIFWFSVSSLLKNHAPHYVKQALTSAIFIIMGLAFFEMLFEKGTPSLTSLAVIIFPYAIAGISGIWLHELEPAGVEEEESA
ncbi:hypothetical protein [Mucilaginibacter celer]|uniref:Uncharacterized protein n=1 Tax=Mucilaginibacter celer TaxID=2305508 RepID=A0A494VVJ5_9SPHI|nr:hypothetical protein [Mucilaginibacter celer]AYL98101.1 hypothetical protein HYN43_023680 [Mucilaginibacter celer]